MISENQNLASARKGRSMSFSLRQIRYFVAVAETGKIISAAAAVNISPSAITEAVHELESITGTTLLDRHRKGVTLTYEGHRFLQHCKIILAAVSDAQHAVGSSQEKMSGVLTIGTTITVAGYMLSTPLSRFKRNFPNIEVRVFEHSRKIIDGKIRRGDFDLAVILTSNFQEGEGLELETLLSSRRRLWVPPHHRLLKEKKVSLVDFVHEPYIQLTIDEAAATTKKFWGKMNLKPHIIFRTESVEAVRSMVATGMGVTILSDMVYRPWSLEGERIESIDLNGQVPSMDVGLVWKKDHELPDCAQVFIEFFRKEYTSGRPKN